MRNKAQQYKNITMRNKAQQYKNITIYAQQSATI